MNEPSMSYHQTSGRSNGIFGNLTHPKKRQYTRRKRCHLTMVSMQNFGKMEVERMAKERGPKVLCNLSHWFTSRVSNPFCMTLQKLTHAKSIRIIKIHSSNLFAKQSRTSHHRSNGVYDNLQCFFYITASPTSKHKQSGGSTSESNRSVATLDRFLPLLTRFIIP